MDYRRDPWQEPMVLMSADERRDLAPCITRLVDAAAEVKMTARSEG